MRLSISNATATKVYSVTNVAPAKPYLTISGGYYLPLTTAARAGLKLTVASGTTTYRAKEYSTVSASKSYYSSSVNQGNLSNTTALTQKRTTTTEYLTKIVTTRTEPATKVETTATKTEYHTTRLNWQSLTISCDNEMFAVRAASSSTVITSSGTYAVYVGASDFGLLWSHLTNGYATITNTAGFVAGSKSTYSQTRKIVGTKQTRGTIRYAYSAPLTLPSSIQGTLPPISTFTFPYEWIASYSNVNTYQKLLEYRAWLISYSYVSHHSYADNNVYYTYLGTTISPDIFYNYDSIGTTYYTHLITTNTINYTTKSTTNTVYKTSIFTTGYSGVSSSSSSVTSWL